MQSQVCVCTHTTGRCTKLETELWWKSVFSKGRPNMISNCGYLYLEQPQIMRFLSILFILETDKKSEHEKSIFTQKYNILMDLGGSFLLILDHDRFYTEFHSIQYVQFSWVVYHFPGLIWHWTRWEPPNSKIDPRNFDLVPPILRKSMKSVRVSISEDFRGSRYWRFPCNNIMNDQKHWKNHFHFSEKDFFNVLKFHPIHVRSKNRFITILTVYITRFIVK